MNAFLICLATFVVMVPICSEFEWRLHSGVMHKPIYIFGWKFDYPFIAHHQVHHQIFKWDKTYILQDPADRPTITMAWWNGPLLSVISSIPGWIVGYMIDHMLAVGLTSFFTVFAYYGVYETIHLFMHLPAQKKRLIGRIFPPYKWLNGHHILHHRWMKKNFNVVLPLADWWHKTLLRRSPMRFDQPRGPLIPDVQPLNHEEEQLVVIE